MWEVLWDMIEDDGDNAWQRIQDTNSMKRATEISCKDLVTPVFMYFPMHSAARKRYAKNLIGSENEESLTGGNIIVVARENKRGGKLANKITRLHLTSFRISSGICISISKGQVNKMVSADPFAAAQRNLQWQMLTFFWSVPPPRLARCHMTLAGGCTPKSK